jgi:hypothetical protein
MLSRLVSELFGHKAAFYGKKPPGWADFVHGLSFSGILPVVRVLVKKNLDGGFRDFE